MQIKSERAAFSPLTLTVTIESLEELKALVRMTALDETIPDGVQKESGGDGRAYQIIQRFLADVRLALPRV